METLELVLGIVLLVMAVFLIIAVLMQSSKNHRLSGTIAGGAETFFGKQKGKTIDALLSKLTTVISIIFVLCVVAIYVLQPETDPSTTPIPPVASGQDLDTDTTVDDTKDTTVDDAKDTTVDDTKDTTVDDTKDTTVDDAKDTTVDDAKAPVDGETSPVDDTKKTPLEDEKTPPESGETVPTPAE